MKTKFLIIALSLLFSVFAGLTSANENSNNAQAIFKNSIAKNIVYPEFAKKVGMEGIVYVSFDVSTDGKIVITQVNGNNQELINYVVEKVKSSSVNLTPSCLGSTYNMKFTFKLI